MLRVTPDPLLNTSAPLIPTKDFLADEATGAFGPFEMGDWGAAVEVRGRVAEKDPSSTPADPVAGAPIAFADLRAEGKVRGGGSFTAAAKTDAEGRFTLRLLPSDPGDSGKASTYTITISPRYGSTSARTVYSLFVEPSDEPVELPAPILCPPKPVLAGRVLAPRFDGEDPVPLGGVPIYVDGNPASASPGASSLRNVVTDADGTFTALVEPGSYQVVAAPGSDFAWSAQSVVTAATPPCPTSCSSRAGWSPLAHLPQQGQLGDPVGGATVSVFRSPTSSLLPPLKIYEGAHRLHAAASRWCCPRPGGPASPTRTRRRPARTPAGPRAATPAST
jgi:hypothetical protein